MNQNELFILIGIFGLGFFIGLNVSQPKALNPEQPVTIMAPAAPTIDYLTVDDLDLIYTCVDTKIVNQHREAKFPCISVRGDSLR